VQGRHGKKAKKDDDDDDDDDDMSSSGDDEDEVDDNGGDEPPKMHYRTVMNVGGINRVRSCPQQPGLVAVWCDNGQVKLLEATKVLKELADEVEPSTRYDRKDVNDEWGIASSPMMHALPIVAEVPFRFLVLILTAQTTSQDRHPASARAFPHL